MLLFIEYLRLLLVLSWISRIAIASIFWSNLSFTPQRCSFWYSVVFTAALLAISAALSYGFLAFSASFLVLFSSFLSSIFSFPFLLFLSFHLLLQLSPLFLLLLKLFYFCSFSTIRSSHSSLVSTHAQACFVDDDWERVKQGEMAGTVKQC